MANYWIGDAKDRVLGPLPLEALRELITAGRIHGIVKVSLDGKSWAPIEQHPEIAGLQAAHVGEARRAWERKEAERLHALLADLKGRAPHEIFGIAKDASLDEHRAAFFRLVKRFYPDSSPTDTEPELIAARTEIFSLLSGLMSAIERQARVPAQPPAPPPAAPRPPPVLEAAQSKTVNPAAFREIRRPTPVASPAASPARARLQAATSNPTYEPKEFVGLERRENDRLFVTVQVTVKTCRIFTENKLLNISTGGAFIPCQEALELGEKVELIFKFKEPQPHEINASGSVVWWSAGEARQPRGFGVRFTTLAPADRAFIEQFVREANAAR